MERLEPEEQLGSLQQSRKVSRRISEDRPARSLGRVEDSSWAYRSRQVALAIRRDVLATHRLSGGLSDDLQQPKARL